MTKTTTPPPAAASAPPVAPVAPAAPPVDPDWVVYQNLRKGTARDVNGKFVGPDDPITGTPAPATERAAAAEAEGEFEDDAPEPAPGKASPAAGVTPKDLETFQGLAKRFKVPAGMQEAAKALPREELLAWTAQLATMQARFDELSGAKGKAKGAPDAAQPSQPAGTPKAAEGAPEGGEKGSDKRSRLVDALQRNGIDDEGTQAILDLLGDQPQPSTEQHDTMRALAEQLRQMQETQARTSLQGQFPGLKDDERYASVRERVARWITRGDYSPTDVEAAMRDAAAIEFHGETKPSKPKARVAPPTNPGSTHTEREIKDPEWDAYLRLKNGESAAEIARSRFR